MRCDRRSLWVVAFLVQIVWAGLERPCEGGSDGAENSLPTLVLVRTGTRVDRNAPGGWTDLVVKALPRIVSGDVETLPAFAVNTATVFRTVILADVGRAPGGKKPGHVLKKIGLGLCVREGEADTVITGGGGSPGREALGLVERQVFAQAEDELMKARILARTPTCAILTSPSTLKVGRRHEKVFLSYAILVDAEGGRVDTHVWADPARSDKRTPPGTITNLAPGLVYPCELDVEAVRLLGQIPVSWSFAMRTLPPGRVVETPPRLRAWLADTDRIASNPEAFERLLRGELTPTRESTTARGAP